MKRLLAVLVMVPLLAVGGSSVAIAKSPSAKCHEVSHDSTLESWTYHLGVTTETRYRWVTETIVRCRGTVQTRTTVTMWYLRRDLPAAP